MRILVTNAAAEARPGFCQNSCQAASQTESRQGLKALVASSANAAEEARPGYRNNVFFWLSNKD